MSRQISLIAVLLSLGFFQTGCQPQPAADSKTASPTGTPTTSHVEEFHSHTVGPKGGVLAVLGQHQLHAEFLPDEETGIVTAYVYNDHFKPTLVEAKEIALNIMVDGAPKKFSFLVESDGADGKVATFKITDKKLAELIHDGWEGNAQASITVKETPISGNLAQPGKSGEHKH